MAISAYITNLGKYNEGYLVGKWVRFPVTPEELQKVFKEIMIDGIRYEEFFITDYEVEPHIKGIASTLGEYADLEEINYLSAKLEAMSEYEAAVFQGAASVEHHSLTELINLSENLDSYTLISGISDESELGEYLFEEERAAFAGMVDKLGKSYDYTEKSLARYIEKLEAGYDAEAQGRDFNMSVTGGFCESGFIYESDSIQKHYTGREDIPDEYRLF